MWKFRAQHFQNQHELDAAARYRKFQKQKACEAAAGCFKLTLSFSSLELMIGYNLSGSGLLEGSAGRRAPLRAVR
jgi:hypothetical protein